MGIKEYMDLDGTLDLDDDSIAVQTILDGITAAHADAEGQLKQAWETMQIAGGYNVVAKTLAQVTQIALYRYASDENATHCKSVEMNEYEMGIEFNRATQVYDYWDLILLQLDLHKRYWDAVKNNQLDYQGILMAKLADYVLPDEGTD